MEIVDGSTDSGDDSAPGMMHRFNSQLPYKERIPNENGRLLRDAVKSLRSFDAERDDHAQVLRGCSILTAIGDLKYSMDDDTCVAVTQLLFNLVFPASGPSLPWRVGNKLTSALNKLISKKSSRLGLVGRLVLPWRPVFDVLKEAALRGFPLGSNSKERARLFTLLPFIGEARRYWAPGADREIWDEVKDDLFKLQTQEAFKALFVLCYFLPSRSGLYDELLPTWFSLWGRVDHCKAWDGAWLTILCRARKHASPSFDWVPYMADIFSHARTSVHTPLSLGDAGSAPLPGNRSVAFQYQALAPPASRSGTAAAAKLGKLLVFLLGKGGPPKTVCMRDVAIVPAADEVRDDNAYGAGYPGGDGNERLREASPAALDLIALFRGLRTYFHPSNGGRWSTEIALLTASVCKSLGSRVGAETALRQAGQSPPGGELTRDDAGLVVEALLPLVLEMLYSKSSSVGSTSNLCLSCLAGLSPKTVAPVVAELILRALDPVASINHTHQAPAALRAFAAVFRPLMYPRPYLAPYLPAFLELSLPGLDPNDVFKTTVTLQLFHRILCWIPVQGNPVRYEAGALDGWKPPPPAWLDAQDSQETGCSEDDEALYTACEGLGPVMMEWSVALLDRLFEVLRHKDKSSKMKIGDLGSDTMNVTAAITGLGGAGGAGSMLSTILGSGGSDAALVSLIGLVTQQLFTMADEPAGEMASAKVFRFVTDSPLPNVEKDAAAIVEMVAWARPERTVATLFPALCDGLLAASTSPDSPASLTPGLSPALLRWRLRLLSGLARGAGSSLAPKGVIVRRLIAAGVKHSDKRVRKSARKLLRKALHGLAELTGAETRSIPPGRWANCGNVVEWRRLCEPVPPSEHEMTWTRPSVEGLTLAAELMMEFVARPMEKLLTELEKEPVKDSSGEETKVVATPANGFWREELKTMDYAIRGGISLLGDRGTPGEDDASVTNGLRDDVFLAVGNGALSCLLEAGARREGPELFARVASLRAKLAEFLRVALEASGRGEGPSDVKAAKLVVRLSRRIACTRGAREHSARRQAMALVLYKQQLQDVILTAAAKKELQLILEAAAEGDSNAVTKAKDILARRGSGGEVAFPRRWLIGRVVLQHIVRSSKAPRIISFAARDAARSPPDGGEDARGSEVVPWPASSAVLGRYQALFSALVELSSSEYATVRAAAQVGVGRLGTVYPWFARQVLPRLIDQLSLKERDDDSPEEDGAGGGPGADAAHRRLTGACYLLHQSRSMRRLTTTWKLLRKLLLALCDSQLVLARLSSDKQERAAARVTILFTSYVSSWQANPITDDEDEREFKALRDGLLDRLVASNGAAPSVGGGWRYQLMASWCLLHLVRPAGSLTRSGLEPRSTVRMGTAPNTVWQWFADCLAQGDGQPLQRLALGALARLLSTAEAEGGGHGEEVSALLCSRTFLKSFLRALGQNHKKQATEAGAVGAEQWSLGVKEILQDAGRGDIRELFPRLRFATRSRLFWARNARLVSAVVVAVGHDRREECIRLILEEMAAAKAGAPHEDKRSFDCAAAEVGGGIVAVLAKDGAYANGGQKVLRDVVLPFVISELERVSMEGRLDWTDAIRFALDGSSPAGSELLVSKIVERTTALLQGGGKGRDDYSLLLSWLSFVGAVLIELSASDASSSRAVEIAQELCPLLIEGLDHPFKACREEVARDLFLVANVVGAEWGVPVAKGIRDSILAEAAVVEDGVARKDSDSEKDMVSRIASLSMSDGNGVVEDSALLASAMVMSDDGPSEEQEAATTRATKRLSLRRETVLQWVHHMVSAGDHARYLPVLVALLPVALQSVRDSNIDVANMGRSVCLSCAAALATRSPKKTNGVSLPSVGGVMDAVLAAASSAKSWRIRRNAVAVACVLQTRLHFVLTPAQHGDVDAALLALLGDTRPEVHSTARLALSTRVAHLTPGQARVLCASFATEADNAAAYRKKRRKIAKRKAAEAAAAAAGKGSGQAMGGVKASNSSKDDESGDSEGQKMKQTGVLGLSAVVLAAPCDVPSWVPAALESLARHVDDESPGRLQIRQAVTYTFKEFRRTHQDKWQESHKARFTRDQLDTFDDVLGGAHSYFV